MLESLYHILPGLQPGQSIVPAVDLHQPVAGVVIGPGGEIAVVGGVGAEQIVDGLSRLIPDETADLRGVVQSVDAHQQQVAHLAAIVVGVGVGHKTVARVALGVFHEPPHVDKGVGDAPLPVAVPAVVAAVVHGDPPRQQHLGAEVHAVASLVGIGVPFLVPVVGVGQHVL